MPEPKTTVLFNLNKFIMESLILSEFDSCRLTVEEMSTTQGGSTSTTARSSTCCAGDSDNGARDSCNGGGVQ